MTPGPAIDDNPALEVVTDERGAFALEDAPAEEFEVDIHAGGRSILEQQGITPTQTTGYRFTLEPAPERPAPSARVPSRSSPRSRRC